MPMKWDAEAHAKLFAATIKVHDLKPDYAALAKEMGNGCTAKAITHQFAHLRARAKSSSPAKSRDGASASASSTPRGGTKAAKSTPTKAKSAKKASKRDDDDDDDDEQQGGGEDYDALDEDADGPASPSLDRSKLRRGASVNAKRSYLEDSEEEHDNDDADDGENTPKRVKREDSLVQEFC